MKRNFSAKRILSFASAFLFSLILVFPSFLPARAETFSGSCGENASWSLDSESGELVVSGSGEISCTWSDHAASIRSVRIENGIVNIPDGAFANTAVVSVTLPDSVTRVGRFAFFQCGELKSAVIPDGVLEIGESAFCACPSLEEIALPFSQIADQTAGSVYHLPFGAFFGDVSYPGSVAITQRTLRTSSVDGADPGEEVAGSMSYFLPASLRKITLSGEAVSARAFENFSPLRTLILKNAREIGPYAFEGCSGLREIVLPGSLQSVGDNAFSGCASIRTVSFDGTESEKEAVRTGAGNEALVNAAWSCKPGAEPDAGRENAGTEESSVLRTVLIASGGVLVLAAVGICFFLKKRKAK